jgi:2,4-dichlorophenol 6-monooxygenase
MANVMAMEQYFDQTNEREGAAKRQDVHRAMDLLDLEFRAHGAEAGWFYNFEYDGDYGRSGDIRNPQVNEDGKMELLYYRNTTRPGSQLPHAWLAPASGGKATTSTRDLIRFDKLVLLATSSAWKVLRVPFVEAVIVNSDDGDYVASPTTWRDTFTELSHTGALLVRPDGIIAYRFTDDEILHHSSRGEVFGTIVNKVLGIQARS